jgi:hypothetical protein
MYFRNNILVLAGGIQPNGTRGCALGSILEPNMVASQGGYGKAGIDIQLWGPSDQLSLIGLDTKFGTIKNEMESGQTAALPPATVLRDRPSPAVLDGKGQEVEFALAHTS